MVFLIVASLFCGYIFKGNSYIYKQLNEKNPLNATGFTLNPTAEVAFFMSLLWPLSIVFNTAPQLYFFQFFICIFEWIFSAIIPFLIMFLLNLLIKEPLYIASAVAFFSIICFVKMLYNVNKLSVKSSVSARSCKKHRSVKEACETLDYFSKLIDESFFDRIIRSKIEELIKRNFDKFTDAFDPIEGKAKEWTISQIVNISGDLLESGRYCVYRGVLSSDGENLWKFYSAGLDELLKLDIQAANGDKINQEWINNQKRILRKNISEVG